ncbi:hypothetical protein SAMN05216503_0657 [Polaribacter sp. KT25b]|uniref:hypothetical protein n=1 Tax=Polaribacter sp. KT25b TaxID=1855336 RepID=UPI00087AEBA7|nr:hypothetical protein [Polaribacter sp. KT25b]SDR73223.1 hypothetical protein SAMN05216503_0657 [Polaribacter sp. KT25b]
MIKKITFLLVLFITSSLFSQQINLDKYQYIIVPVQFDFVKKTDQYQTSSLTKFLLKKKGFKVFLSNETLPNELNNNRCLALFASVKDDSSMFTIKNTIEIKDCYGILLYSSEVGKSKNKDYKKGYQEAIRKAYETMTDFEYSYNPASNNVKNVERKEAVIVDKVKTISPIIDTPSDVKIETLKEKTTVSSTTLDVLYAQATSNGFQLVNTTPKVVFVLLKTNVKDIFIINEKNGILYKLGDNWVAEFYENNQLITKEYQIKF